jgi:hypothetical protein
MYLSAKEKGHALGACLLVGVVRRTLARAHRRRRPEPGLESPEGAVGDGAALVESPLLRDRVEEPHLPHDAVGLAQEQVAALVEREREE